MHGVKLHLFVKLYLLKQLVKFKVCWHVLLKLEEKVELAVQRLQSTLHRCWMQLLLSLLPLLLLLPLTHFLLIWYDVLLVHKKHLNVAIRGGDQNNIEISQEKTGKRTQFVKETSVRLLKILI